MKKVNEVLDSLKLKGIDLSTISSIKYDQEPYESDAIYRTLDHVEIKFKEGSPILDEIVKLYNQCYIPTKNANHPFENNPRFLVGTKDILKQHNLFLVGMKDILKQHNLVK